MWNVVRRVGQPGRVRVGLGLVLCAALAGCSDGWPLGVDSAEEGVRLTTDRIVYQLEDLVELELFNGYRFPIVHSCMRVERREGGEWSIAGGMGGPCPGPGLMLQPGERHTTAFRARGAPSSMSSDPIPGPFHLGGAYRICVTVQAERPQPHAPITVCTDPFQVEPSEWTPPLVSLAVGGDHTCGVTVGGAAYCWGLGNYGQLGHGESELDRWVARPVPVEGDYRFESIAAGVWHTCGLVEGGEAYCWGRGHAGQLGSGSVAPVGTPVAVAGDHRFTFLAAGGNHTCGVTTQGAALCWGFGGAGRLGNGSTASLATPAVVAGDHFFTALAPGGDHTCGVTADGGVFCWGFNGEGQLGTGEAGGASIPVPVATDLTFIEVAAGEAHTCGLTTGGSVYCWGRNTEGQLGDGSSEARTTPAPVSGGRTFAALGAGDRHTCGVANDGVLYCWGLNGLGQLGSGTWGGSEGASQLRPVPAFSGHPFAMVTGGGSHTCGVRETGTPYCWGLNERGQLGDGSRITRNRPAAVAPPLPEIP